MSQSQEEVKPQSTTYSRKLTPTGLEKYMSLMTRLDGKLNSDQERRITEWSKECGEETKGVLFILLIIEGEMKRKAGTALNGCRRLEKDEPEELKRLLEELGELAPKELELYENAAINYGLDGWCLLEVVRKIHAARHPEKVAAAARASYEDDDSDDVEDDSDDWAEAERSATEYQEELRKRQTERVKKDHEMAAAIRAEHPDNLVECARELFKKGFFLNLPDVTVKKSKSGDFWTIAKSTDQNRWEVFRWLFGEGKTRPHFDLFTGRPVDHCGKVIDKNYSVVDLVAALAAAGIHEQEANIVRYSLLEWALREEWNDLTVSFIARIPEWDGVDRLETELNKRFGCSDTPLNRSFDMYLWLSIYNRVTKPGCYAPMVPAFIGGQHSGKSNLARRINQAVMGNEEVDSITFDLSEPQLNNLRRITGKGVIASVGEMTGFTKADMGRLNSFATLTADNMNWRFRDEKIHPRQWIMMMDGNKYSGIQRDSTGNRRFYPKFVGQLPDKNGQPSWNEQFKTDYSGFEESFWQIIAQCHNWMRQNGYEAYVKFVDKVVAQVREFNDCEMKENRGTVEDPDIETFFPKALLMVEKRPYKVRSGKRKGYDEKSGRTGVVVEQPEFSEKFFYLSKKTPNYQHLEGYMRKAGGEPRILAGGIKGFIFFNYSSVDEMNTKLAAGYTYVPIEDSEEEGYEIGQPVKYSRKNASSSDDEEEF